MGVIVVPIISIMTIQNLAWLAPFSTPANIALLAGFVIISYYVVQELPLISRVEAFAGWYVHTFVLCVSWYIEIFNVNQ